MGSSWLSVCGDRDPFRLLGPPLAPKRGVVWLISSGFGNQYFALPPRSYRIPSFILASRDREAS